MRSGRNDGDSNGYRADLCSDPLPIGEATLLEVRRFADGAYSLSVNGKEVSRTGDGNGPYNMTPTDRSKKFRIGSRHERHDPKPNQARDYFEGQITGAALWVGENAKTGD